MSLTTTSAKPTKQQKAQEGAALAVKLMNARKPKTAIEECVRREIDPIVQDPAFASTGWPTTKASGLMQVRDEIQKTPSTSFTKLSDKNLVLKTLGEEIGVEGTKYQIRQEANNIRDDQFKVFHGPHVVNISVKDDQGTKPTNKVFVGEAKAGVAQLKADQGTPKGIKREAKSMSNSAFKSSKFLPNETKPEQEQRIADEKRKRRDTGDELTLAIASKNLTYVAVSTPYDPNKKPKVIKRIDL